MAGIGAFDTRKQLTFYGAYHSHPINIAIHMCCIPLLVWSFEVMIAPLPMPDIIPHIHYEISKNLVFDLNWSTLWIATYVSYYFVLDPVAAILYLPQTILTLLYATAFSYRPDSLTIGAVVHAFSWIMQFIGHGLAEGRAPALLDNFWGAMFTAPFFVHLEILFKLGYRPKLHHDITNSVGVEIARIRRAEAEKKRAKNQ